MLTLRKEPVWPKGKRNWQSILRYEFDLRHVYTFDPGFASLIGKRRAVKNCLIFYLSGLDQVSYVEPCLQKKEMLKKSYCLKLGTLGIRTWNPFDGMLVKL